MNFRESLIWVCKRYGWHYFVSMPPGLLKGSTGVYGVYSKYRKCEVCDIKVFYRYQSFELPSKEIGSCGEELIKSVLES